MFYDDDHSRPRCCDCGGLNVTGWDQICDACVPVPEPALGARAQFHEAYRALREQRRNVRRAPNRWALANAQDIYRAVRTWNPLATEALDNQGCSDRLLRTHTKLCLLTQDAGAIPF